MIRPMHVPLHMAVELSAAEESLLAQAKCVACGADLDTAAIQRYGRITCSNRCRQRRYRANKKATRTRMSEDLSWVVDF